MLGVTKYKDFGDYGENMILKYFPHAKKVSSQENKEGTDFIIWGKTVQVKADRRIAKSGNLYFEKQEKSHPHEKWRKSPMNSELYIFITIKNFKTPFDENIVLYKVFTKEFKRIKRNYTPRILPNKTSFGYIIPISDIKHQKREFPQKEVSTFKKEITQQKYLIDV